MSSKPQSHSSFTVTSSALCYGTLHDIHHGSTSPIQPYPAPEYHASGTVKVHSLMHNVSAQNGTWFTYKLIELGTSTVKAWFACHSTIDPDTEIHRILKVSGSPYEPDHGSTFNTAETAQKGVLVINRYDWSRPFGSADEIKELDGGQGNDGPTNSVGLIDLAHAKEQIEIWKDQITAERIEANHGAWFYIPHTEYMFGRFGFNEQRTAAISFLFFTGDTYFIRTAFVGMAKSLLVDETPMERLRRHLREGEAHKYEGFKVLNDMLQVRQSLCAMRRDNTSRAPTLRPEKDECLGLYNKSEYLLKNEDFESLRQAGEAFDFIDPLRETTSTLINELVMSYLEYSVVPLLSDKSKVEAAAKLCPKHQTTTTADGMIYKYLTELTEKEIPGFDITGVGNRIKEFLNNRCQLQNTLLEDNDFIRGLSLTVAYLVGEVQDLATQASKDAWRDRIVPSDIRITVFNDEELIHMFQYSKFYWYGSN